MASPGDLHGVRRTGDTARFRDALPGARRLAHGVGQGFQVVAARAGGRRTVEEPDDLPAPRGGEPLGVLGAQVVAVRLGVGRQRAEDRRRIGVDVRQRRDGGTAAGGARTATYRTHGVGRYRTPERAAMTLHRVTRPCRPRHRAPNTPDATAPNCPNTADHRPEAWRRRSRARGRAPPRAPGEPGDAGRRDRAPPWPNAHPRVLATPRREVARRVAPPGLALGGPGNGVSRPAGY